MLRSGVFGDDNEYWIRDTRESDGKRQNNVTRARSGDC